jgi:hypothetical protein
MAAQEIVVQQAKAIAGRQVPEESGGGLMASIVKLASNPNVDIDKLNKLLDMQDKWEIRQDKKAMRHALAEFKKNPPAIIKKRMATVQTKAGGTFTYSFADLDNITTEAQKGLAEYGITHGYAILERGTDLTVTCILKYGSYEEPGVPLTSGPDTSGTKNDIQAKASTLSYLEKYTFLAAVGMAAGMPDTDGNRQQSSAKPTMAEEELIDACTNIEAAATREELKTIYAGNYKAAQKLNDRPAMSAILAAYEKRKAELQEQAA